MISQYEIKLNNLKYEFSQWDERKLIFVSFYMTFITEIWLMYLPSSFLYAKKNIFKNVMIRHQSAVDSDAWSSRISLLESGWMGDQKKKLENLELVHLALHWIDQGHGGGNERHGHGGRDERCGCGGDGKSWCHCRQLTYWPGTESVVYEELSLKQIWWLIFLAATFLIG